MTIVVSAQIPLFVSSIVSDEESLADVLTVSINSAVTIIAELLEQIRLVRVLSSQCSINLTLLHG